MTNSENTPMDPNAAPLGELAVELQPDHNFARSRLAAAYPADIDPAVLEGVASEAMKAIGMDERDRSDVLRLIVGSKAGAARYDALIGLIATLMTLEANGVQDLTSLPAAP